jgi:hypothetical protein
MRTRKVISQERRIKEAFDRIKEDVTPLDRAIAAEQVKVSKMMISRCLNGIINNNDKALLILNIFRQRIADREKQLVA